jgi:soluble lytic murein transglycosylase
VQTAQESGRAVVREAQELELLCRALRENDSPAAYERLASFARRHAGTAYGGRAALALAYRDYNRKRFAAAREWAVQARVEGLLEEYAIYWEALATRALGQTAEALASLEEHRQRFPASAQAATVVALVAEMALELGQPVRARRALDGYEETPRRPALLLLRARAKERAGMRRAAAEDYQKLMFEYPLRTEAEAAEKRLAALARIPGTAVPAVSMEQRLARAEALFAGRRWREARREFGTLAGELSGSARERAELRRAQSRVQLREPVRILAGLKLSTPEVDAERHLALAQAYRARNQEGEMLRSVEQAVERAPQSAAAEEALFLAGNYYWLQLERERASEYYGRLLERFPTGGRAPAAHWRMAWSQYLERRAEAASRIEEHLRRFPGSIYAANALYWLGRLAERESRLPEARGYYIKLRDRFPQTYFSLRAAERLREIGTGPVAQPEILAAIPAPPALPELEPSIPLAARERWDRAAALRSIAFDASAELELRAAYEETGAARMMVEAAKAAHAAGRHAQGVAAIRQLFPSLDSRRWEELPAEVWRASHPLAYESLIERYSAERGLDASLVAGLIRQESQFQRDAVSPAGAVGLMQILPSTGRRLARSERATHGGDSSSPSTTSGWARVICRACSAS